MWILLENLSKMLKQSTGKKYKDNARYITEQKLVFWYKWENHHPLKSNRNKIRKKRGWKEHI